MNAPMKSATQPWQMSAAEASAAILGRSMSVEELTRSCLERIAARDADEDPVLDGQRRQRAIVGESDFETAAALRDQIADLEGGQPKRNA